MLAQGNQFTNEIFGYLKKNMENIHNNKKQRKTENISVNNGQIFENF